jgi:hypothetical protein
MPNAGDSYIVTLEEAHFNWGVHRHTNTRDPIPGEGYIKIPAANARQFNIYNSNEGNANILYNCSSADGFLNNEPLKACGCSKAGGVYAKQFQGDGNLKVLGQWFNNIGAQQGDQIEVRWISPTDIIVTRI